MPHSLHMRMCLNRSPIHGFLNWRGVACLCLSALLVTPIHAEQCSWTVAQDGTGDFLTIQEALDQIPQTNTQPRTIHIRKGIYPEQLFIVSSMTTLIGDDSEETIITWDEGSSPGDSRKAVLQKDLFQAARKKKGGIERMLHKAMGTVNIAGAHDVTLKNLTLRHTGPASDHTFALRSLLGATRLSFQHCRFIGLGSDTVSLWSGGEYALSHCFIQGTFHFLGVRGTGYVIDCEFNCLGSSHSLFHQSHPERDDKLWIEHCRFDGPAPFGLGSYFDHANWYFIQNEFSDQLRPDGNVFLRPKPGTPTLQTKTNAYYSGNQGPAYPWLQDNLHPDQIPILRPHFKGPESGSNILTSASAKHPCQ